jgi:hypothetical protein
MADSLSCWFIDSLFHWFLGSLIHGFVAELHWFRFIESSTQYFTHSLIHYFIASLIHWFLGSLIGSFIVWFIDSPLPSFIDSLIHRFIGSMIHSVSWAWICSCHSLASQPPCAHSLMHLTTTSLLLHLKNLPIGHLLPIVISCFRNLHPGAGRALPGIKYMSIYVGPYSVDETDSDSALAINKRCFAQQNQIPHQPTHGGRSSTIIIHRVYSLVN